MLVKLRIAQRLGLLLMLPVIAVVVITVPFTADQVDRARAAAAVVDSAGDGQAVETVIAGLQRESLLALGYLASPRLQRASLVAQVETVREATVRTRTSLSRTAPAPLATALSTVDQLDEVRRDVLTRTISASTAQDRYHAAVAGVLDALRPADQPRADATGLRQMSSVDSLLRACEQEGQLESAVVLRYLDAGRARDLVTSATLVEQVQLDRFRQQADPDHAARVAASLGGPSATATRALVDAIATGAPAGPVEIALSTALASADGRATRDVAVAASRRAATARRTAVGIGCVAAGLVILVVGLGTALIRSVARPLRRLTVAASTVADVAAGELVRVTNTESGDDLPRLVVITIRSADEIGQLAAAVNRIQAGAALMLEQQLQARHNLAIMFASVARRTNGLVARQLTAISGLDRTGPDTPQLATLRELEALITQLRRSADGLLVIAGGRDRDPFSMPVPLLGIVRAATAEVQHPQRIRVTNIADVTVAASAVADLGLLLAELLDIATAFSAPDSTVDITAIRQADPRGTGNVPADPEKNGVLILVVDHGVGMPELRLAKENSA